MGIRYDRTSPEEADVGIDSSLGELYLNFFNKKSCENFEELSEFFNLTNRHIYIKEIELDTGSEVEFLIRFFNRVDLELETPIEKRVPIKIFIDSVGGALDSTLTICDAIKSSITPVWTINQGKAHSGGAVIFCCGRKRFAYPHSSILFHEGYISTQGDAHKFENGADFYKIQRKMMKDIILSNTDITLEEYETHKKDDWWFTADEALNYGILDEIISKENFLLDG